jgi:hypothetical protein
MEEVYIIDGEEISLSEIQEAAAASEMEVEEYISTVGGQLKTEEVVEKKEKVVVENAAPVATEQLAATESTLAGGFLDSPDEKQPFNPNKGEFYYSTLPEYSEEKIAYKEWKYSQANPEEKAPINNNPTGLLSEDVKANTQANIEIDQEDLIKDPNVNYTVSSSDNYNKAYLDDYVTSNPAIYKIIQDAETKEKQDPNNEDKKDPFELVDADGFKELEKYYPGRFKSKIESQGSGFVMVDTEDLNIFGNPKEVDPNNILAPIRKELNNRSASKIRNSLAVDEDAFVEANLSILNNFKNKDSKANDLNVYYKTGELSEGAQITIDKFTKRFDKGQFTTSERKIFDEYKKTGELSEKLKEKILRKEANAGDKAYDENGNLIGVSIDEKNIIPPLEEGDMGLSDGDIALVKEKTDALQDKAPTVDVLIEARKKAFFKLLAIDENISKNNEDIKETDEGFVNDIINYFTGSKDRALDDVSDAGRKKDFLSIGKNITKIMSKNPLALEHNEAFFELLALDRAIKLNSNLMTIEEAPLLARGLAGLQKGITGENYLRTDSFGELGDVGGSPTEAAAVYAEAIRSTGLQVDQTILDKGVNNSSIPEISTDALSGIAPLLMAIYASKGVKVKAGGKMYGVKPALASIDKLFKSMGSGKSQAVKRTYNVLSGATKELITMNVANEVGGFLWNGEKISNTDAVSFGVGNSAVAGMTKKAALTYLPYFSEFARTRLGVVTNAAGRMVLGGVSATSVAKSVEGLNIGINWYSSNKTEQDELDFKESMKHLTDIDQLVGDVVAFSALSMRGSVVTDVKNRILAIDSRTQKTVEASKTLGVKEFSSPGEIAEALNNKMKELGVDKMNSARMNSPEVKKQTEALKLAASVLNTQNNVVQAKKSIAAQTNNQKTTEAKIDIISKKIQSGQELSVKDLKEIGKFSDTPVSDGNNGYNFRTPVEALNLVMAEKMGIERNTHAFILMQKEFGEYSEAIIEANKQFKGESKQIQAKKDLFLGKILDARKIKTQNLEMLQKIQDNPSLDVIYKPQIQENNIRITELGKEMMMLGSEGREIEVGEYQADIDYVAKEAPGLDVDFRELPEGDYIDIAAENGFNNTSDAVFKETMIIKGKTYKNVILVNRDQALKNGAVSAASHELSHFLTRRAFKGKNGLFTPEGRETIDSFINDVLSNEQRAKVQERINKKYNPENKSFQEQAYEEYLNVFLDATKRGDVKMNDTFKQKFNSFMNSKSNVNLETGEGIKNFLDLLSRSGKNGSLDVRIKDFAKETAKTEPLEAEFVKLSKSDERLDESVDKVLDIKRNEAGDITMTKEEWKSKQGLIVGEKGLLDKGFFDASIVEGTGKDKLKIGSGDVVIEGEGFSRDQYILDVRDKLKTVIMNWNPQAIKGSKGSLMGWINNPLNLNKKKLTVFEDYKKIALANKAARGEYTGAEKGKELVIAPEPFQAGRTNPLDILPSELRAEAIEEVTSNLPKTPEAFQEFLKGKNYKTLKGLANKTTAKFFGVPENKVAIPRDNLSGTEPQRAQMKLTLPEVRSKFIDIIPRNNIEIYKEYKTLDGKRVIDKKTGKQEFKYVSLGDVGTGKATGLPGNIRKALYKSIGRPKGVNNEVFVLKDNLTEADIMKVFGIIDGKKSGDFELRTPDAQAIKGAMELVSRGIGNKIVRDFAIDMGLANEALDLAQGKNVYMASLSEMREKPSFVERDYTLNHVGPLAEKFANLPYGVKTEEAIKQLLNEEFKTGPRKYKTFTDTVTGESYTFTSKDINGLAKSFITSINRSKEVPFLNEANRKSRSEINKRDIKEFIANDLMVEGSERATQKFFGNLLPKNSKGKVSTMAELSEIIDNQVKRRQLAKEMWKTQVKETENKVDWINDNFGLSEQFNSASKIAGGRFQYYEGISDFLPQFNNSIKDSGYKVVKVGAKYFIETGGGQRIKQIDRFGKTQSNSNYALKLLEKAFNKEGIIDINSPKVKELVDMYQEVADRSRKILDKQFEFMMNKYKTGEASATDMALFTMELKSGMGTVLRMAAPLREMYEPLPGEKLIKKQSRIKLDAEGKVVLNSKGKPVIEKLLIWEHSKPAESMVFELLDVYLKDANVKEVKLENDIIRYELNQKGKEALEKAYDGYEVAIIPKAMDNVITAIGRAEGVEAGKNRYYDDLTYGRSEMRAVRNLVTGSLKGYEWSIAAEQASNKKLAKVNSLQGEPAFTSKSEKRNNFDYLKDVSAQDKALRLANDPKKNIKKIRVFDFDDTLATSKNKVFAVKGNERIVMNAEKFAKDGARMKEEGYEFDFSDFNKVTEGGRGPMFEIAERIKNARGNEDLFVLTARAPESREAIYEFLKNEGLEFKKENIIGLGKSTGEAKARWLVGKAAEGYNDFYFADDAVQNIKAVKDAMSVLDVKSKVQRAMMSESENRSIEFNKILEAKSGIEYFKEYSAAKAKTIGASKGKFKFFIPPSAEDFVGLIYPTLSKGKLGDTQMAWYKKNLLDPYARASDNISRDRIQLMSDFKALKKDLNVPKDLRETNETGFTNEQAVRVYLFNKTGQEVPGLSKADLKELTETIDKNPKLKAFAEQILTVTKGDGYAVAGDNWLVGTVTTDLLDVVNTTKRNKYLEEWQNNVNEIYSKENMNKLEAIHGPRYREAMENMLTRMKSGRNRTSQVGRIETKVLDFINGSNAAIMFFNTRSALLQTISATNFMNMSFNNPAKAGIAFANQPQYWKDFTRLMNSDFLVDRRNGLRINIAESEVADAAATSKNKAKAVLNYILQKGYLPTQYADSFAIASGGATFYRNRVKDLIKKGSTEKEAESIAYKEFREVSETSQQSSRPDKISQQQSSSAGRLILMFANTPMQYARIQKRAIQDLANGRGDAKENVGKIAYYGVMQNLIFNALQQALFKMGFDDDDSIDKKAVYRTANGMLDGTLRGLGIGGAAVSVGKNFLMDIYERSNRSRPEYVDAAWKLMQFSPPISSKVSKIRQAAYPFDSKKRRKEIYDEGFSLKNPALLSGAKVVSATTNIPLDRLLLKYENIQGALNEDNETWERLAMMGGWPKWSLEPSKNYVEKKSKNKKTFQSYIPIQNR